MLASLFIMGVVPQSVRFIFYKIASLHLAILTHNCEKKVRLESLYLAIQTLSLTNADFITHKRVYTVFWGSCGLMFRKSDL